MAKILWVNGQWTENNRPVRQENNFRGAIDNRAVLVLFVGKPSPEYIWADTLKEHVGYDGPVEVDLPARPTVEVRHSQPTIIIPTLALRTLVRIALSNGEEANLDVRECIEKLGTSK